MSDRELARLDDRPEYVQFSSALSEADYRLLGEWIREHPDKTLRAYGSYDGSITDLDFLRWFPTLTRFEVDVYELDNIEGLRYLPDDLEVLALGATRRRLSLQPISRFHGLRRLFLDGHTKDIDAVARLTTLADLTLRSITLPSLELIQPLRQLQALDLKLGGTRNLDLLPTIGRLRYLELWQVRGLDDISAAAELADLEYLFLQSLRRVERLPDFSRSDALKRVWLENMKGLFDLTNLATAPALEHLALVDMPHLTPEGLRPLLDCPALRSARVGLGSDKKNRRAREILGSVMDEGSDAWDPAPYRVP